jgi:hypothetical protein
MKTASLAAVCVLFAGTPVLAGAFTPLLPLGSTALDFDTQDGAYSFWRVATLDSINAIRTTFQAHRLGQDPRWAPAFTIALVSGSNRIDFRIASDTRRAPLTMRITRFEGGKPGEDQAFETTIGLDEKLDLAVDWTPAGDVTVTAGQEAHSIALGAAVTSVEFYGSTGEAEFDPLRLGHFAP